MHFPYSKPLQRTNEDVFFAYYSRLTEWALQITRNEQTEAEDLVQDFYLSVTRITWSLDERDQLDRYLFRMLRNLYYARLRRARREPIDNLSIVDYDSVEQGLAVAERSELLFVHDHLKKICCYACQRKGTNRSAGILILRFFLGYYPSELMKIVQVPRSLVDQALHIARNETRTYLQSPKAILPIRPEKLPPVLFLEGGENEDSQGLFLKLRKAIFSASEGKCFGRPALKRRYAGTENSSPLTAQELAHLVSCPVCLDQVNEILHLPLLAERSPEYGLDRDSTSGPSGGSGDAGAKGGQHSAAKKASSVRKVQRKARELYEHRPLNLELVVDGDVRSSQKVTAEINEFRLTLSRKEQPSFIEVLSEQQFRLAFLQVAEPESADDLEQVETVSLSDDRSLVLTLTFAAEGPVIHVLYRDPVMVEEPNAKQLANDPLAGEVPSGVEGSTKLIPIRPRNRFRHRAERAITWLSKSTRTLLVDTMNPLLATAMICAVAAAAFFVLSLRTASVMKPSELLARASVSESAAARSGATGVIVESVRIQTPHRKVERMLYRDIQGKRRPKDTKLSREDAFLRGELEAFGVLWNDPLSAGSFRDWHDHVAVQRDVVKRPEKGLLTLTTTVAEGSIASESLTVREADFHPIRRTVELRDARTVEIAELNYSVLPWTSVNPDLFEPVSDAGPVLGGSAHSVILPRLPQTLSDIQIDEAELGARLVLSRLHLDGNDRLQVIRQPMGVEVHGVVTSDAEKRLLQVQLYMVPHATVSVMTIQEMAARPAAASDVTSIRQSSAATNSEPSALEKYFENRGMDRTAASASVHEFVESSFAVNRESEQISDLLHRFASSDTLSGAARAKLSELLSQHKAALLDALGREERQLVALQLVPQSAIPAANSSSAVDDLREIGQHNRTLCAELTSESASSARPAQQIAQQLRDSIAQVRAVALRISATAQLHPPSYARSATTPQNR